MSMLLQPQKVGLTFGFFIGGLHLVWTILVALGFAQPLLDFVFWLHMLKTSFVVEPFDLFLAVGLVFFTFFIGSIIGYVFALVWNRNH